MKRLLILAFVLTATGSNCQTYSISYTEINVLNISVQINYSGSNYSSPYFSTYSALNTLQQRYDYYHGIISNEWGRLNNFELLNSYNRQLLNNHKIEVQNYFYSNNQFTHVDWARNGQFAVQIVNYIGSIYNVKSIKSEISLLKAIRYEYYRLKNEYPSTFHKSTRYYELAEALNKLKSCSPSEIDAIAFKYGLW